MHDHFHATFIYIFMTIPKFNILLIERKGNEHYTIIENFREMYTSSTSYNWENPLPAKHEEGMSRIKNNSLNTQLVKLQFG